MVSYTPFVSSCVFDQIPDMKLVNDVVELTFDPRFKKMFPS